MLSILNSLLRLLYGIDDGFFELVKSSKIAPETEETVIEQSTSEMSASASTTDPTSTTPTEPITAGSYNFVPKDGQYDPYNTNLDHERDPNPLVDATEDSTTAEEVTDDMAVDYVEESKRFCVTGRLIFPLISRNSPNYFKTYLFFSILLGSHDHAIFMHDCIWIILCI